MKKWLMKTEPGDYSFNDLINDGKTIWDGVKNNWALKNLREISKGDIALIYHTGNERQIAGVAKVVTDPYPDPDSDDEKRIVVDIKPLYELDEKISLKMIKEDSAFKDFMLVKFSRLSVMPVDDKSWLRLSELDPGIKKTSV